MDDVKQDRRREHDARDPVIRDPGKRDSHPGKERGDEQGEHGRGHDPVEEAGRQRMAGHATSEMTQHYTLADHAREDLAVRKLQERISGDNGGKVQ